MKIRINEYLFGVLSFILFVIFFGSFLTSIVAIFFGEVSTKTNGIIKYSLKEGISIFIFSILIVIILYLFIKYIEPKENKKKNEKVLFSKCPRCREVFNYNELEEGKCKYCKDMQTMELEEYYKKYPEELKEE